MDPALYYISAQMTHNVCIAYVNKTNKYISQQTDLFYIFTENIFWIFAQCQLE